MSEPTCVGQYISRELTDDELRSCERWGKQRHDMARSAGIEHRYGADPDKGLENDILGVKGEFVVSRVLKLRWDPVLSAPTTKVGDVENVDVRTRKLDHWDLILHPTDADDRPWVLVTGRDRVFTLVGWILGKDGKKQKWWLDKANNNRKAFFVPQKALNPFPIPEHLTRRPPPGMRTSRVSIEQLDRMITEFSYPQGYEDVVDALKELKLLRCLAEAGADGIQKSEPSLAEFTFGGGGAYAADDD